MRKLFRTTLSIALLTLFSFIFRLSPVQADVPESYIVAFDEGTSGAEMEAVLENEDLEVSRILDDLALATVKISDPAVISQLEQQSAVMGVDVEASYSIPSLELEDAVVATGASDPIYEAYQWHIRRIYSDQAWAHGYTASHDTVVGIIDSGVASNHPDLAGNIVYEACFTSYQASCDPYPQFPNSMSGNHGTVVAGIVASLINDYGVVGVAPNVGLANLNVTELGPDGIPTVYESSIWAAIEDAADQGIDVVNMSFGEIWEWPLSKEDRRRLVNWRRVVNRANARGVTLIAGAGNEGLDINDVRTLAVPCELPRVMCVGSTNIRPQPVFPQVGFYDEQTFYTNYGRRALDIAAPGGDCGGPDFETCLTNPNPLYFIWTTNVELEAGCSAAHNCPASHTATIGTSLSTPHVAGVAALAIDANYQQTGHKLRPNRVQRILTRSADDIGIPDIGAGLVNAWAAIQEAL